MLGENYILNKKKRKNSQIYYKITKNIIFGKLQLSFCVLTKHIKKRDLKILLNMCSKTVGKKKKIQKENFAY